MQKNNRNAFILLCLVLLPWLVVAGNLLLPRYSDYSDLAISHIPNAIYLVNAIQTDGQIPLWSTQLLSGYPFAENPLTGLWYPPAWIAYVFPQPLGFNLLVIFHLLWGGWGLYTFLKLRGTRTMPALFGAISFTLMPKIMTHWAAGHVTLLYAVSWTPWLLAVTEKWPLSHNNWRNLAAGGILLGIITLADPRWVVFAAGLWFANEVWMARAERQASVPLRNILEWVSKLGVNAFFCVGISAALTFGLLEYSSLATRSMMSAADSLQFSLPFNELPGLVVPDFGGFAEWTLYPGSVVLLLAIYACAVREIRTKNWFWIGVFFLSLVYALGSQIPGLQIVAQAPLMDLLRVPPRSMFVGGLSLIILAVQGLEDLLTRETAAKWDPVFYMSPILGGVFFLLLGLVLMKLNIPANMIWTAAFMGITFTVIAFSERNKFPKRLGVFFLFGLAVIDLTGVNFQAIDFVPLAQVHASHRGLISRLSQDPDQFRVYAPANTLTQLEAAKAGIELANGIDPLQYTDYVEYFESASRIPYSEYSVTLPPLEGNTLSAESQSAEMNAEWLAVLNVKYVVTNYAVINPHFSQVYQKNGEFIYLNSVWHGPAWIETEDGLNPMMSESVVVEQRSADRILVSAQGPGQLVLSEVDYPGWIATVNGDKSEILRADGILRSVELKPGENRVEFVYRPTAVLVGCSISICTWLLILGHSLIRRRRHAFD